MKNKYLLRSTKKRQNRFSMIMITIVVLIIAVVVSVGKYNIKQKQIEYDKRQAILEDQIEEQVERATEIEEYEKYTKTKKYAEDVAKEKLGLVNDDEIIFKTE